MPKCFIKQKSLPKFRKGLQLLNDEPNFSKSVFVLPLLVTLYSVKRETLSSKWYVLIGQLMIISWSVFYFSGSTLYSQGIVYLAILN